MSYFPVLFLCFLFTFHATADADLIPETCKKIAAADPNVKYDFCVTSLQAAKQSGSATLPQLSMISTELASAKATETNNRIKELLKDKKLGSYAKAALNDCADLYSDAISTLQEAITDCKAHHYVDASYKVSAVLDDSTTCEDGFKEKKLASPVAEGDNQTIQLSIIALSIINMVH